ncbi:MAG: SGNH/GDSL hydrolase family protein [Ferruginibacter sp.]
MKYSNNDDSKNYLALGDSYTIGESELEINRFPNIAAQMLRAQGKNIEDPEIIAKTGWTTQDLLNALEIQKPAKKYSIVTLLIGVNDQYQGKSLAEYRTNFSALVIRAIGYAGGINKNVVVLSIPDYSVTPFAAGSDTKRIAEEIDQFNSANKEISVSLGVNYIDITPISREGSTDPSLLAVDGLHPSAKQYKRWAGLLVPVIKYFIL